MLEQHLTEFQIQEYADGKLSSAEMIETERHLVRCQKCQRQVDFYKQMFQTLAEEKEYVLPADFAKNSAGQIIPESVHRPWLERIFWGLGISLGFIMSFYWFDFDKMNSQLNHLLAMTVQAFQSIRFEWLPDKEIVLLMVFSGMLIKVLDHFFAMVFTARLRKK